MNHPAFNITCPVPDRTAASDGPGCLRPPSALPHPAPLGQDLHRLTKHSTVHCCYRFRPQSLHNTPLQPSRSLTYQHDGIQETR
jgi:hypothetical protein